MARASLINPWFGVLAAQLAAGRSAIDTVSSMIGGASRADPGLPPPRASWASPHRTLCELATVRVLDFTPPSLKIARPAALVVAPFALHRASVGDFAPGHSVVEALLRSNAARIYLTDWRSAIVERRFDSIDTYLAVINVVVDDLGSGEPVALVGLCQGGWLAAAFAARFPRKVRALVLAGAPIDIAAERSLLGDLCAATPREAVDELLNLGDGLLLGRLMLAMWPLAEPTPAGVREILQMDDDADGATEALVRRFMKWNRTVVDLPGVFYRQTVDWIFRENRLASGRFRALGEVIDLKKLTCPLFLLAAENDEITSPGQLTATAKLVGTPQQRIETHIMPGRHLSLFMGRATLAKAWPLAARFVAGACEAHIAADTPAALRVRPAESAERRLRTQRSTSAS
jgi:poly(3-hydroxyalkanoate) synthetase